MWLLYTLESWGPSHPQHHNSRVSPQGLSCAYVNLSTPCGDVHDIFLEKLIEQETITKVQTTVRETSPYLGIGPSCLSGFHNQLKGGMWKCVVYVCFHYVLVLFVDGSWYTSYSDTQLLFIQQFGFYIENNSMLFLLSQYRVIGLLSRNLNSCCNIHISTISYEH